jgi:hypothetical protein
MFLLPMLVSTTLFRVSAPFSAGCRNYVNLFKTRAKANKISRSLDFTVDACNNILCYKFRSQMMTKPNLLSAQSAKNLSRRAMRADKSDSAGSDWRRKSRRVFAR